MLVPEGAREATARMRSTIARGTGVGRKERIERREVIAASTAAVAAASVKAGLWVRVIGVHFHRGRQDSVRGLALQPGRPP